MKVCLMSLFVGLFTLVCEAQMTLEDEAISLATIMKVPMVSTSQVWTASLFPVNGMISTNEMHFVKKEATIFFTVSSNAQIVAYGRLFEYHSYDNSSTCSLKMLK